MSSRRNRGHDVVLLPARSRRAGERLVFGLKDSPQGLPRPDRAIRVLRGNLRRAASDSH